MDLIKSTDVKRVLDIATGSGNSVGSIREMFKSNDIQITGIDISRKNIEKARSQLSDGKTVFAVMNSAYLEFLNDSFDAVTIINSLHHFDDLTRSLTEAFRVLKRDGIMIICEMFSDTDNKEQLAHIMLHHWWAKIDHQLDIPHYKTFSREHILKIVEGLPFRDIEYSIEDNLDFEVDREMMKKLTDYIDIYKDKADKLQESRILKAEGESIRNYIAANGFRFAPQIIVTGRK